MLFINKFIYFMYLLILLSEMCVWTKINSLKPAFRNKVDRAKLST